MQNTTDFLPGESMNQTPPSPNLPPLYAKCIACPDFVTACRGIDITTLSGAEEKRAYHKAIRKAFGILIKDIYPLVKSTIGKSTTDEYFGSGAGDYKWTTVTTIHNALLFLVAQKKGLPLCEHSCSSSSSEIRNQMATAELKAAAAELKAAQHESNAAGLAEQLTTIKAKHNDQIEQINAVNAKDKEWHRNEIKFWRRFAFVLLAVGLVLLAGLLATIVCLILALRG